MRTKNKISLIQFIVIGFVMLFSISCRKDNEANNMIVDIDGNVYHSVTIGTQVWMVENKGLCEDLIATQCEFLKWSL